MAGGLPAPARAGGWLGRQLLTDLLHQTSVRSIFRAVEDGDGRVGLVLVLAPEVSAVPHLAPVFDARMRQAAGVLEQHLVALRHWDETDGLLHVELGVVAGTGLRTVLEHEPMPLPRALDLTGRLADALEAAHARGLAHLGLTPSTVVVDPQGRPVLTDLGVTAALVQAGIRPDPGEASWSAPEVRDGSLTGGWTPVAGQRADVWSLAALLQDCLTGLGPAARSVRTSPALVGLLQRAQGPVEQRPATPGELVRMARFAAREPLAELELVPRTAPRPAAPSAAAVPAQPVVPPRPASAPSRPARPPERPTRRSGPGALLVALVVLAVGVLAALGYLLLRPDPPRAVGPAPTSPVSVEPSPTGEPSEAPSSTPTPGGSTEPPTLPSGATVCEPESAPAGGLSGAASGNANTSCGFAEAARAQLAGTSDPFASQQLDVTSPVTEQTYAMSCAGEDALITCTGGNDAVVLVW